MMKTASLSLSSKSPNHAHHGSDKTEEPSISTPALRGAGSVYLPAQIIEGPKKRKGKRNRSFVSPLYKTAAYKPRPWNLAPVVGLEPTT